MSSYRCPLITFVGPPAAADVPSAWSPPVVPEEGFFSLCLSPREPQPNIRPLAWSLKLTRRLTFPGCCSVDVVAGGGTNPSAAEYPNPEGYFPPCCASCQLCRSTLVLDSVRPVGCWGIVNGVI